MKPSSKKTLLAVLVVPLIALTAACGGSDDNATSSAPARASGGGALSPTSGHAPAAKSAPDVQSGDFSSLSSADQAATTAGTGARRLASSQALANPGQLADQPADQPVTETAAIISKGLISLHSNDIDKARFDLQELLDSLNGTISDEQSNAGKNGDTIRQRLVLRVPSKNFAKAMDGISGLKGTTLVSRSRSSEDVTTQVIDNNTRVRTQRASLARVRSLLARATSLQEVISIESQLSRRQAALDSLEAQQKYLADQTSLSTINVYLTVPSKKAAAHPKAHHHNFFSGLRSGWHHLGSSTDAVLTAVGAVLPFAALAALIGFPVWAARRRRKVAVEA